MGYLFIYIIYILLFYIFQCFIIYRLFKSICSSTPDQEIPLLITLTS